MDIIKQLKENKEAFGLMGTPMGNKAEGIGKKQFEIWGESNDEDDVYTWLSFGDDGDFDPDRTYRLRPEYTEEPEVVKCEVRRVSHADMTPCTFDFVVNIGTPYKKWFTLDEAPRFFDFIGFLYEDGCITSISRMYKRDDGGTQYIYYPEMGDHEVLTPTHCLFRKDQG